MEGEGEKGEEQRGRERQGETDINRVGGEKLALLERDRKEGAQAGRGKKIAVLGRWGVGVGELGGTYVLKGLDRPLHILLSHPNCHLTQLYFSCQSQ